MRNADSAGHNLFAFSLVSEISLFACPKPSPSSAPFTGAGMKKTRHHPLFLGCFQTGKLKSFTELKITGNLSQEKGNLLRGAVKFTFKGQKTAPGEGSSGLALPLPMLFPTRVELV